MAFVILIRLKHRDCRIERLGRGDDLLLVSIRHSGAEVELGYLLGMKGLCSVVLFPFAKRNGKQVFALKLIRVCLGVDDTVQSGACSFKLIAEQ